MNRLTCPPSARQMGHCERLIRLPDAVHVILRNPKKRCRRGVERPLSENCVGNGSTGTRLAWHAPAEQLLSLPTSSSSVHESLPMRSPTPNFRVNSSGNSSSPCPCSRTRG